MKYNEIFFSIGYFTFLNSYCSKNSQNNQFLCLFSNEGPGQNTNKLRTIYKKNFKSTLRVKKMRASCTYPCFLALSAPINECVLCSIDGFGQLKTGLGRVRVPFLGFRMGSVSENDGFSPSGFGFLGSHTHHYYVVVSAPFFQ